MPSKLDRRRFVKNSIVASAGAALTWNNHISSSVTQAAASEVFADGWGNLKGRLVFDGTAPEPKKIKVDKDEEVCGDCGLIDESLVVDAKSSGLKNVIVYVYLKRGKTIPVHESYDATKTDEVVLNNKNCRFEPHVLLLRTTQQFVSKASDPIASNVKIDAFVNSSYNQTVPSGEEFKPKNSFRKSERTPIKVSCPIHFWEKAWLVVRDNPYMAVTDFNGYFEILNLPVGTWTFQFWHEAAGYVDKATLNGEAVSWRRGQVDVEIKQGDNDMGEIKVKASEFKV